MVSKDKVTGAIEVIKGRLYWISDSKPPKCKTSQAFYFCIDDNLVYEPFCEDFGPLNLAMTHKYCLEVDKILTVSFIIYFKRILIIKSISFITTQVWITKKEQMLDIYYVLIW